MENKTVLGFLALLKNGGVMVSSADCTPDEISDARKQGHLWVDFQGFGYVYVPLRLNHAEDAPRKAN